MPKYTQPPQQKSQQQDVHPIIFAGVCLFALLALGSLFYLALNHQPAEEKSADAIHHFLQNVQQQGRRQVTESFSADLKQRFSPSQVFAWFESQELLPLENWQILNSHVFKGRGVSHVQIGQALLRFDYTSSMHWQLNNFCRVDQAVKAEALKFMRRLQSGNISAAQQQTVDAYYPNRQGQNFPPERLAQLHQQLKDLPQVTAGPLTLNDYYDYRQTLSSGSKSWSLSLHHWDYAKSGCRFFVFDFNE